MTINRELSQFASFVKIDDSTKNIGIATTSTPSIGIGTASPSAKFEVVGNTKLQSLNVTGITTIEVSSTSPALRVTQTGTGDAILVEDSTNPDSSPFVVTETGRVGIGTTNPSPSNNRYQFINNLIVRGNDPTSQRGITIDTYGNSNSQPSIAFQQWFVEAEDTKRGIIEYGARASSTKGEFTFGDAFYIQPNSLETIGISSNIIATHSRTNVGIGTTNPTSKLHVAGNALITGVGTITTFNSTTGTITNGTITNLTGTAGTITTFNSTTGTITNLNSTTGIITNVTVSGLTSTGSLTVTGASVLFLQGIDVTGTASIDALTVFPGPSNLSGQTNLLNALNVAGITTFQNNIIQTSGLVGIGTTNPLQRFQIGTANTLGISTDGKVFVVTADAKVGIGTTNPIVALDVAGAIRQELHTPGMLVGLNDDIGKNWTKIEMGVGLEIIRSLVYCGDGIVLAGGGFSADDGDIYRSTDYGLTFTKIEMGAGLEQIQSLVYCGNGIVLAGSGNNADDGDIYRSTDFGSNWSKIEMGAGLEAIRSLVYCGNGIVLAGGSNNTDDGDIYRSTDYGLTFTKIEMGPELEAIYSLLYCGNGIVLAGSGTNDGNIYRSIDFGLTFTEIEIDAGLETIDSLVYCGNGIVLAGGGGFSADDGDIYRSTDFGSNWSKIEMGAGLETIDSLVYCGNGIVLAGSGNGIGDGDIYRSDDFGLTFTIIYDIALKKIGSLVYCGNGIVLAGGGDISGDGDIYRSDVGFSQASTIQGIHHQHLTGNIGIGTTNPLQRFQIGVANTLGINSEGTIFVVTSNADVGIGTTNPTSKLHVQGNVLITGVSTFNSNIIQTSGLVGIGTTNPLQRFQIGTANTLGVSTDGKVFVVTSNADVGIGTTNPTAKLDVNGNIVPSVTGIHNLGSDTLKWGNIYATTFNGPITVTGITTIEVSSTSPALRVTQTGTGDAILVEDSTNPDSSPFVVTETGSVGIGTTNPQYQLEVHNSSESAARFKGGSGDTTIIIGGPEDDLLGEQYITYQNATTNTAAWMVGMDDGEDFRFAYGAVGEITNDKTLVKISQTGDVGIGTINPLQRFQIGVANTLGINSEGTIFVVTSNADVGIGTTNPTSKLHVVGNANITGVLTATTFVGALTGTATSTNNIPNLTGAITSNNTTTSLGSFSSSNLSTALTDETGSGAAVFATSPTLVTPALGAATATSIVVGSGVTINASGINAAAGIITASQLSTGASGTGVNITTDTISGPTILTIDPSPVGVGTTSGAVRIKGDLYVDGTQFIVNSTTIELADFNVGIATTVGTNALLDGAGIGIGSTGIRKTLTWSNSSTALKSSEDFDVASGKVYKINGTSVLSNNTLGSGILTSSLTSVGTLGSLSVGNVNSTGIITATTFVGALTGTASSVTTNANLTGHVTSVGNAAVLGSFTSLQLLTALTDETGSGSNVFATSPTLVTPILGSASATNLNVSGVTTSATFNTGVIGSQTSGILTTTATTADQVLDSLPTATFQTARYQVSIACTGQLVSAGMTAAFTSVGAITAGSGYIDPTYTNVAITGGSGNDARANIGIGVSINQVGFTSASNVIVTTAAHGLGIGGSIAVTFASNITNSAYTGAAVTAGNVYYALGTGSTTFTLFNNASGTSQVTGIGTTTFTGVGNTMTKAGGVISVVIVSPGSGYVTGNTLSATLGTIGSGFSFPVSTVVRNYQSTDVMIMQSVGSAATACDYIEYASLANSEILASFRADISGANARLLVTPTYRNNTLKVIRSGITV